MPQRTLEDDRPSANTDLCCIKGCAKPVRSVFFCASHYAKWNRHGHPLGVVIGERHGDSQSKEFKAWLAMRKRCLYPKSPNWSDYGGRGIKVCSRWRYSYQAFLDDMGRCPRGATLDRIDPDGDYTPKNCRWLPRERQASNRRNVLLTEADVREIRRRRDAGEPVTEIALDFPATYQVVYAAASRKSWKWVK